MPNSIRPGDILADRYRLDDLLSESGGGRFWRAHDGVLKRHVALHTMATDDTRVPLLLAAARRSAAVVDARVLRVLDAEKQDDICFVVNEWGYGTSLDIALASNGPLEPRQAAWLVAEVADSIAVAHAQGVTHGRLVPENVLIDRAGDIRIIGLCVDAAMHGLPEGSPDADLVDLGGLLHAALTGRWAGSSSSAVPAAPHGHGRVLRPRQVRAGVPRPLDDLVDTLVNGAVARALDPTGVDDVAALLCDFGGDPAGIPGALAAANPLRALEPVVLPQVPEIGLRSDPPTRPPTSAATPPDPPDPDDPDDPDDPAPSDEEPAETASRPSDRPLFAPTPPGGSPYRRPRPAGQHPEGDAGWPVDTDATGRTRPVPPADEDEADSAPRVPGRRALWIAAIVGMVTLVLVAVAILTSDRGAGSTDEPAVEATDAVVSAEVFAASGDRLTGSSDPALAVDADPDTVWRSGVLDAQPGPDSQVRGVGLLLDLGRQQPVTQVGLSFVGAPTEVALYVLSERPETLDAMQPVADLEAGERERVGLRADTAGRYLLVWMTSLPEVEGGFEAAVTDVRVRG